MPGLVGCGDGFNPKFNVPFFQSLFKANHMRLLNQVFIVLYSALLVFVAIYYWNLEHGDYASYIGWFQGYEPSQGFTCGSASPFVCGSFAIQKLLHISNPYVLPLIFMMALGINLGFLLVRDAYILNDRSSFTSIQVFFMLLVASPFLMFVYIPLSYTLKQSLSIALFSLSLILANRTINPGFWDRVFSILAIILALFIHWITFVPYIIWLTVNYFPIKRLKEFIFVPIKLSNYKFFFSGKVRLTHIFLALFVAICLFGVHSFFEYQRLFLYIAIFSDLSNLRSNFWIVSILFLCLLLAYAFFSPRISNPLFEALLLSLFLGVIAAPVNRIYLYFYIPVILQFAYSLCVKSVLSTGKIFASCFIVFHAIYLSSRLWNLI